MTYRLRPRGTDEGEDMSETPRTDGQEERTYHQWGIGPKGKMPQEQAFLTLARTLERELAAQSALLLKFGEAVRGACGKVCELEQEKYSRHGLESSACRGALEYAIEVISQTDLPAILAEVERKDGLLRGLRLDLTSVQDSPRAEVMIAKIDREIGG